MKDTKDLHERLEALKSIGAVTVGAPSTGADVLPDNNQKENALETSEKPVVSTEKEAGKAADSPISQVGLDIGTSHIVVAQNKGTYIDTVKQLNAFFTVPTSKLSSKNESSSI